LAAPKQLARKKETGHITIDGPVSILTEFKA
jgi:hypothetical protein